MGIINRQGVISILIAFLVFTTFLIRGSLFLDPDFGWHLRLGEIILKEGIPKTDPFSYTMPDYPLVEHAWLSDVLIAKLYPLINIPGLIFVHAFLAIVAIFIAVPRNKFKWSVLPIFLSANTVVSFIGIRPQVLTWIFFAGLIRIIFDDNLWWRLKWALPPMFVLWANLHGSFGSGIAILLFAMTLKSFEERTIRRMDIMLALFSTLATFINPYGARLWGEVYRTVFTNSLRSSIIEWMPAIYWAQFSFYALFTLTTFLLIRYRSSLKPLQLGLYAVLGTMALSSVRHVPLWIFAALPLALETIKKFSNEAEKYSLGAKRFEFLHKSAAVAVIGVFLLNNLWAIVSPFVFKSPDFYPEKAVDFLKNQVSQRNLFSTYNWGGYLIYKMPQNKVFVNGLMPTWKQNGYSAFEEFADISKNKIDYRPVFEKYDIETVLLPNEPKPPKIAFLNGLPGWFHRNSPDPEAEKSYLQFRLKENGWQEIYKDETAVILRR